jgi:hypothetical protein
VSPERNIHLAFKLLKNKKWTVLVVQRDGQKCAGLLVISISMMAIKEEVFNCFIEIVKPTLLTPIPISLAKLSFVRITPLWRDQRKISLCKGSFNFQIILFMKGESWLIR